MAARIAYTQYKRRNNPPKLPMASNASIDRRITDVAESLYPEDEKTVARITKVAKTSSASSSEASLASWLSDDEKCFSSKSGSNNLNQKTSKHNQLDNLRTTRSQIAIYPQYIAQETTTITIREVDLPKLSDSFTVTLPNGREIFQVNRERPSLSHRQHIIDPVSHTTILTVRRDIGKLPVSYGFDDDSETKVLDLQGNFFVPLQGARATAYFTNAADRSQVQLSMQGSWHNRRGAIKNEKNGEILATMKSGTFNTRNLIGSRRTYEVTVSAGTDLAIVTGMVIALDARSS